jgi:hypothetical protein
MAAEVKGVVTVDIHPLERAFEEAKKKAKELGEQIGEVGNDLGKGVTGFDIGKALGIGGAVYAAGKLGDALIDAAKEGYEAFQKYADAVNRFKYQGVGTSEERGAQARETAETVEGLVGKFNFDQLAAAASTLKEASQELNESPEKLKEMLSSINTLGTLTGQDPGAIAESYRKASLGMKEAGGGGSAASKFMKSTEGLEEPARALQAQRAQEYLSTQGLTDKSQLTAGSQTEIDYRKIAEASVADFMKQEGDTKGEKVVQEELIGFIKAATESSKAKEGMADHAKNHPEEALNAEIEKIRVAFGDQLRPAIVSMTNSIVENMPMIKNVLAQLGTAFDGVVPIVVGFGDHLKNFIGNLFQNDAVNDNTIRARREAEGVDRKLSEGGGSKHIAPHQEGDYFGGLYMGKGSGEEAAADKKKEEGEATKKAEAVAEIKRQSIAEEERVLGAQQKSAEEIAKIVITSDAEHATAQRKIGFEAMQLAMSAQVKAAAMKATAGAPIGEDVQSKSIAAEIESTNKIVNIKANAAAKERSITESSEDQIAHVNEESAIRAATRLAENEKDKNDMTEKEKEARQATRNAEDHQSAMLIADIQAAAAGEIRDANFEAAEKIIDEQLAAADKLVDIEVNGALKAIDARKGPTADEGPRGSETYNKFDKQGGIIEGSHERRVREEKNKAAQDAFKAQNESDKAAVIAKGETEKKANEAFAAKQLKDKADALAAQAGKDTRAMSPEGQEGARRAYDANRITSSDKQGNLTPDNLPVPTSFDKAGKPIFGNAPGAPSGKDLNPATRSDPALAKIATILEQVLTALGRIDTSDEKLVSIFST